MSRQLHVFTSHFNPRRFRSRVKLYEDFSTRVAAAGAVLHTVELAFGDRDFEVTDAGNPNHLQVRTSSELWHKERILNLAIRRALRRDLGIRYLAWIDSDILFADANWAWECVEMLQHYHVLQMFSTAHNLGPNHELLGSAFTSLIRHWRVTGKLAWNDGGNGEYGLKYHPGFAWAMTRWAFDQLGGLFDVCIAGSGDTHMAAALCGNYRWGFPPVLVGSHYGNMLAQWARRADRSVERNVGFMEGAVLHAWHGRASQRGYNTRWQILVDHNFNPHADLQEDAHGCLAWSGNNPSLQDAIRRSLAARNEDSIDV